MPIQIFLISVAMGALAFAWRRARQDVLPAGQAALWSMLWIAVAVVAALPQTATMIANRVGVGRGTDLVLYVAVALLFLLVFRVFVGMERVERQVTLLVRHEALQAFEARRPPVPVADAESGPRA
jgi:hypothetical protein